MFIYLKDNKIMASSEDYQDYSEFGWECEETQEEIVQVEGQLYKKSDTPEPSKPTNEEISQMRQNAYSERTDPLTLRKMRKQALGEWTAEDEEEYLVQIQKITEEINTEFPYNSEV